MSHKNKKNQLKETFSFILLIWGILLIIFAILMFIIIVSNPVSFAINLNNQTIEQGNNLTLYYKITNSWFERLNNVRVAVAIQNRLESQKNFTYSYVGIFNSQNGDYSINTSNLPRGNYTIQADLFYYKANIPQPPKTLTLGFSVK